MKKWIQVLLISATAVALIGCSSKHKSQDDMALDDSNMAYSDNDGAETTGLGDGSGNYGKSRGSQLSRRVYHFDFDSSDIRNDDRPAIEANAEKLAANQGQRAIVEGHTDPRGSREYNIGLGERRAKSVASAMAERGVKRDQLRIVSYGAQKPAASGRSEADYQQDRRSVLAYTGSE